MTDKLRKVLLFLGFYIGWFGCVFAGKYEVDHWSYFIPVAYLALSTVLLRPSRTRFFATLLFAIGVSIVGLNFDALAISQQWIQPLQAPGFLVPHWLVAMWFLFSFSLFFYADLLGERHLVSAVLGLIIGPLTYLSGEALGVLTMDRGLGMIFYSAFWGFFLPSCLWVFSKIQR